MNREDIIRMAREARFPSLWDKELEHFAALVSAAEREACAKVCDLVAREIDDTNNTASYIAAAIRNRSNT